MLEIKESRNVVFGKIPKEWQLKRIKDVIKILPKSNIQASEGSSEGEFPFYTSSQILCKKIDKCLYEGNAITMATGGIASVNYSQIPFSTSTDCLNFTSGEYTKYLYYLICAEKKYINDILFEGSGLKHLQKGQFFNSICLIPPIKERNKITNFLDSKIFDIDSILQSLEKEIKILQDYKSSVITENVIEHNKYKVISENGNVGIRLINSEKNKLLIQIKYVLNGITDGTHGTFERQDTGEYLLSAKNVFEDGLHLSETESMISNTDYNEIIKNGYPRKNDVLMCCVGTVGRAMLYDYDKSYAFQRSVLFLRPDTNKILPKFLYYSLNSNFMLEQEKLMINKSAQDGLYQGKAKTLMLYLPNLETQKQIVVYLDNKCKNIDSLLYEKKSQLNKLNSYKESIIREYITGKKLIVGGN